LKLLPTPLLVPLELLVGLVERVIHYLLLLNCLNLGECNFESKFLFEQGMY
jgi:hypothetical protein